MSDIDELFEYYRDICLPAYADAVTHFGIKPQQILVELENALGHVAQYHNPNIDPETKTKNMVKAKDHLMRVTLDSYKMVWVRINNEIDTVALDQRTRLFCINMTQEEFASQYERFKMLAEEARREELLSVGVTPLSALEKYEKAIEIGRELKGHIDYNKVENLKSALRVVSLKRTAAELIIAFIAGVISTYFLIFIHVIH